MHFRRFNFQQTVFTETFTEADKRSFHTAYDGGVPLPGGSKGQRQSDVRRWIEDVMHLFADRIRFPFSNTVMMVESGRPDAIQAYYRRKLPSVQEALAEATRLKNQFEMDRLQGEIDHMTQVANWDHADLNSWLRTNWDHCLSLAHPFEKRHHITGEKLKKAPPKKGVKNTNRQPKAKAAAKGKTKRQAEAA
jgi:hypothetical protein